MRITAAIQVLMLLLLSSWSVAQELPDSLPAFPGAEGFGSRTPGGRGGRVIQVTNLNPSGPGSLQAACSAEGPRIVVFEVSGVIPGEVSIPHGQITIMGQTAPGAGITIKGMLITKYDPEGLARYPDIVIRFLRVRPDPVPGVAWADALQFSGVRNCVLDHLSLSWSSDETMDIYSSRNLTVQWCAIEESDTEGHPEGRHNYALINGPGGGEVSIHHNLFAHHSRRCPAVSDGPADVRNNLVYNFRDGFLHDNEPNDMGYNIIGNYYKQGPNDNIYPFNFWRGTTYYLHDNYLESRAGSGSYTGPVEDPWAEADKLYGLQVYANLGIKAKQPTEVPPVATQSPLDAYELVLANAGCLPRDTVGRRTVNEVRAGSGSWGRHDPGDLLAGLTPAAPPKDTDHDGIPDFWERAKGLNSADSTDHAKIMASGYTALEEYGNLLAQRLIETGGVFPSRGDVNANGTVNIFDLLELIGALRDDSPGWAADLNLDGRVNLFDLLELLRLLAGME